MALKAELYALTHRGSVGDVAFYRGFCGDAASVLELGSGYGRLLTALARASRCVVGLERDGELLALARRSLRALPPAKRRSVELEPGDMQHFAFERRFARVLLPYNGLYCLLSKRAALDCFRSVRAALEPGGVFAFDVWNAEGFHRQRAKSTNGVREGVAEPIVSMRHAGRTWDVFEHSRARKSQQRLDVCYSYVPREGGAVLQIPIAQRYYRAAELSSLLERAGLVVASRYGDFSGAHFTPRSAHLVVVARAA